MARGPNLPNARRQYAEEVRVAGHVLQQRVIDAFAAVPRERFVGPAPWRILNMADGYWTTPDDDPRWLYHNVLVALDESRGLNTGEPSLWAHHFDRLGIQSGERVLQIGAGSGYFTALLAELVGNAGIVLGLEVDAELADKARGNLAAWPHATIQHVEGVVPVEGAWDVVIAFAGVTAPHQVWVDALSDGGRALLPMTGPQRSGFMLRLDRHGEIFAARLASWVGIFPCAGGRRDAEAAAINRAMADGPGLRALKSLRRDPHDADESCWLHGEGWCLSKQEVH